MESEEGPLMELQATSEEIAAVEGAIAYYLDYVNHLPAMTKEEKETMTLLARLQQRLTHSSK